MKLYWIRANWENSSVAFWKAMFERYPMMWNTLLVDRFTVLATEEVVQAIRELPGYEGGPEYAPHPVIVGEFPPPVLSYCFRNGTVLRLLMYVAE